MFIAASTLSIAGYLHKLIKMFVKITAYLLLTLIFWAFYIYSRLKKWMFLANLLFALTLVALFDKFILKPVGASVWWLFLAMTMGIVLHHASILTRGRGSKISKIHGPISHLLFFGAFGVSSALVTVRIYPLIGNVLESIVFGLFLILSLVITFLGFWVGFDKIFYVRLNKKFKRFYKLAEASNAL